VAPQSLQVRVPGKLILTGEYAVLTGAPAVVCAVDRHLVCRVERDARWSIQGNARRWEDGGPEVPELSFAREALRAVHDYLTGLGRTPVPAAFVLEDELRAPGGAKLGLGGSACASVAVVAGALAIAGENPSEVRERVFKLAAVAHGKAQGKVGSALDVAASTFGGTLWTWRFDVSGLLAAWRAGPFPFATQIDSTACPHRERLREPPGLLLVFSGQSASTASLVGLIEQFASRDPRAFAEFVARTSDAGDRLRRGLEAEDPGAMADAVRSAGAQLELLGARSGTPIVTSAHRTILALAEAQGLAGKISGAGGGDSCVIVGDAGPLHRLEAALAAAGHYSTRIQVDTEGVLSAPW